MHGKLTLTRLFLHVKQPFEGLPVFTIAASVNSGNSKLMYRKVWVSAAGLLWFLSNFAKRSHGQTEMV
jgi:hypothetical protein